MPDEAVEAAQEAGREVAPRGDFEGPADGVVERVDEFYRRGCGVSVNMLLRLPSPLSCPVVFSLRAFCCHPYTLSIGWVGRERELTGQREVENKRMPERPLLPLVQHVAHEHRTGGDAAQQATNERGHRDAGVEFRGRRVLRWR